MSRSELPQRDVRVGNSASLRREMFLPDGEHRTYRSPRLATWNGGVAAIAGVIYFFGSISLLTKADSSTLPVAIALVAGLALLLVVLIRTGMLGVTCSAEGITVRNPLRSYRARWQEIEGFTLGSDLRHPSIGIVLLRGGNTITISGIRGNVGALRNDTREAEALIDELNRELAVARESTSAAA